MKRTFWGLVIALSLAVPSFARPDTPVTGALQLPENNVPEYGSGYPYFGFTIPMELMTSQPGIAVAVAQVKIQHLSTGNYAWVNGQPVEINYSYISHTLTGGTIHVSLWGSANMSGEGMTPFTLDFSFNYSIKTCGRYCAPQTTVSGLTGTYSYTE